MTTRVEKHPVMSFVTAPFCSPEDMMIVPARKLGNFLVTDRTQAVLLLPKIKQLAPTFELLGHLEAKPLFKVGFPGWVIRISGGFKLNMALDRETREVEQINSLVFSGLSRDFPGEDPLSMTEVMKVFLFEPATGLVRMSVFGPAPQSLEDKMVYFGKGSFADNVTMIVGPPS